MRTRSTPPHLILLLAAAAAALVFVTFSKTDVSLAVRSRVAGVTSRVSGIPQRRSFFSSRGCSSAPRVTLEPVMTQDKVDTEARAAKKNDIPTGYRWYETMLVLQPKLNEMEKDIQLGYFEKVLGQAKAKNVMKLDRGKHPLSYPMNKNFEAYYVLYSFAGPPSTPGMIQNWSNNPGIDSEGQFLRVLNTRLPEDAMPPSAAAKSEDDASDSLWDL